MGTVIYSASPFQASLGSLGTILFLFVIGAAGLGSAVFRPNQKRGSRISLGATGVFLIVVSFIYAAFSLFSLSTGGQIVTVRLNNKMIATDNCGNGSACTRNVLETSGGSVFYDFNVSQDAYDKARTHGCYRISFFSSKSPFNVVADTTSYHQVDAVTRIEALDSGACQ